MVTYDVVPEIESYLHTIGKSLHSSLDDLEETSSKKMSQVDRGVASDDEEEEKDDENADGQERGRSRKRPK